MSVFDKGRDYVTEAMVIMADLDKARVIARLLHQAPDTMDMRLVRDASEQLWTLLDSAHNDVDLIREALEGSA